MTAPRGLRHQTSLHRIAVHSASVEAVVEKETGVRHFSRFLRSGLQNRRHRSGLRRLQPLQSLLWHEHSSGPDRLDVPRHGSQGTLSLLFSR